jgi:hypothetical protein
MACRFSFHQGQTMRFGRSHRHETAGNIWLVWLASHLVIAGDRLAFNAATMWGDNDPVSDADKKAAEQRRNSEFQRHRYMMHLLGGNASSLYSHRSFRWS